MPTGVVFDNRGLRRLVAQIEGGTKRVTEAMARETPLLVATQFEARRRPGGGAQRKNKPATMRRKGHDQPLVDSGRLRSPAAWKIVPIRDGHAAVPYHPFLLDWLHRLGYGVQPFEADPRSGQAAERALAVEFARLGLEV